MSSLAVNYVDGHPFFKGHVHTLDRSSDDLSRLSQLIRSRINLIRAQAEEIYNSQKHQEHPKRQIHVIVDRLIETPEQGILAFPFIAHKKVAGNLYVPLLSLLSPRELLPRNKDIQGFSDADYTNTLRFMQELLQRLSNEPSDSTSPLYTKKEFHSGDKDLLSFYVRYINGDERLVKASYSFTLRHAVGHIIHEHPDLTTKIALRWKYALPAFAILLLVFKTYRKSLLVISAIAVSWYIKQSSIHEREIDLFAASTREAAEGGIHLFQAIQAHIRNVREEELRSTALPWYGKLLLKMIITANGDCRFLFLNHGRESTRIRLCEHALANHRAVS